MGWTALVHHMRFEEAHAIADQYDLACVSNRQFERQVGEWNVLPIVTRRRIGKYWYNYFENGRYKKSLAQADDGTEPESYAPYYYVPDKIRYLELLTYIRQNFWQFKGIYHPYILYLTEKREQIIYSVYMGVMHMPITCPFDNPMLYFEMGRPNVISGPKKSRQ